MKVLEPHAIHPVPEGVITGENVLHYRKAFGEVSALYRDAAGMDPTMSVYEVYSYEAGHANTPGDLNWGLTILAPLTVNGECNMTRGHYHQDAACAEIYLGLGGEGLLLLMDRDGHAWAERVFPGSLHHIDGSLAHRLVNTGDAELRVGACWPTAAGHDYASIEAHDFPVRVYRRNGRVEFEERA